MAGGATPTAELMDGSKKRKAAEQRSEAAQAGGAEEEAGKRPRQAAEAETSTCHQEEVAGRGAFRGTGRVMAPASSAGMAMAEVARAPCSPVLSAGPAHHASAEATRDDTPDLAAKAKQAEEEGDSAAPVRFGEQAGTRAGGAPPVDLCVLREHTAG